MHVQVQCFDVNATRQSSAEQHVGYQSDKKSYSHVVSNLTPGGTYNITIIGVSNGKLSEGSAQHTLGVRFVSNILYFDNMKYDDSLFCIYLDSGIMQITRKYKCQLQSTIRHSSQ